MDRLGGDVPMFRRRLSNWMSLVLGIVLAAAASAPAEPLCAIQWGKLAIGASGQNPFTADVQITSWQVSPEGSKRQIGPLIVFHVARDGSGRVAIKGPLIYGETGEPYVPGSPKSVEKREWTSWQVVLCDPLTESTVLFQQFQPSVNQPAKKSAQTSSRGGMPGLMNHGFYDRNRKGRDGRWIDLGDKELQGVQGHGYRWWLERNSYGDLVEGNFTEQWISEELATEVLLVKMDQTHQREERTELINIRRVEADPSLFRIPQDYEVVKIDPKSNEARP